MQYRPRRYSIGILHYNYCDYSKSSYCIVVPSPLICQFRHPCQVLTSWSVRGTHLTQYLRGRRIGQNLACAVLRPEGAFGLI